MKGSRFRGYLILASAIPILGLADINGGLTKLGFVSHTPSEDFKIKPDYATETVVVAHR